MNCDNRVRKWETRRKAPTGLAQSKSFSRLGVAEVDSEQICDQNESLIRCEINRASHGWKLPYDDQEDEAESRELVVGFVTHPNETPNYL